MKKLNLIALIILVGTSFSCEKANINPTKITTTPTPKTSIVPIEIGTGCLYGGGSEGVLEQNLVITDSVTWNALKAQMNTVNNATYNFTEQTIDFTQWTVLAAFDQVRPSGGHALSFTSIIANYTQIVATVTDTHPNGAATTVITQPYTIVKIPVSNLPITFN